MEKFSQKEREIFDGILRLAQNGENIFNLKVQQIADAAGIGKGTLYEYFNSRDEILAKALLYSMHVQIKLFNAAVESQNCFTDKLYAALDFAYRSATDNSACTIFNTAMRNEHLRESLMSFCQEREAFINSLYEVLLKIIAAGRSEGSVSAQATDEYSLMAMVSVLCTVMFTLSQGGFDTWENIRPNAFKMLCKALA